MPQNIKLMLIALGALLFAAAGQQLLEPDASASMREYEALHQELSHKENITAAERQQLETLFREINSEQNIKAALMETVIRYALYLLILVPCIIAAARYSKLSKEQQLLAAGTIFVIFIIMQVAIIGALAATLFFFISQLSQQRQPQ